MPSSIDVPCAEVSVVVADFMIKVVDRRRHSAVSKRQRATLTALRDTVNVMTCERSFCVLKSVILSLPGVLVIVIGERSPSCFRGDGCERWPRLWGVL